MIFLKRVPLYLFVFIAFVSCGNVKTNVDYDTCSPSKAHTTIHFPDYTVMVFGPNDTINPGIWEGPICIVRKDNGSVCSRDISLIKEVRQADDPRNLLVVTFSGSNEDIIQLDMDNCEVVDIYIDVNRDGHWGVQEWTFPEGAGEWMNPWPRAPEITVPDGPGKPWFADQIPPAHHAYGSPINVDEWLDENGLPILP